MNYPNPTNFDAYELDDRYHGERYLSGYSADAPGPPEGTNLVTLEFGPPSKGETVYVQSGQANTDVERRQLTTLLYDMKLVAVPDLGPDEDITDMPVDKLPPYPPITRTVPLNVDGVPLTFDYWQDNNGGWAAHARQGRTSLLLSAPRSVSVESLSLRKVKDVNDYKFPGSN